MTAHRLPKHEDDSPLLPRVVRLRLGHWGIGREDFYYYNFYFRRRAFSIFRGIFRKRLRAIVTVNGALTEVFLCTPLLIQKKTGEPEEHI